MRGVSLSPRLRFEVLKRDGFRCAYCGTVAEVAQLEVDHVIPESRGGLSELPNLVTACRDCNRGKSDKPLSEAAPTVARAVVDELADRVQTAEQYASLIVRERRHHDQEIDHVLEAWWRMWGGETHEENGTTYMRLRNGRFPERRSIGTILKRLPLERVLELMEPASGKFNYAGEDACRYFYGSCWRAIKSGDADKLREDLIEAQALIDELRFDASVAEDWVTHLKSEIADKDEIIARLTEHRCDDAPRRYDVPEAIKDIIDRVVVGPEA